ncbi:PH domain-containing protein, partial [Bacillus sp. 'calajunan']
IAAHALSLDRLEIVYGAHKTEVISPKDKDHFINLVTSKNSNIEIK